MEQRLELARTGLRAVILNHSYVRNVNLRVDCFGHTNVSGHNGAGKTSFLALFPIFAGAKPDQVVERGKSRFHKYYLPSVQSYIVFEYSRPDGLNLVFVYLNSTGDGVNYRFVKSGYEEFAQSEEFKEAFSSTRNISETLKKLSLNMKIVMSPQINTTVDYVSILSNDQEALRAKRNLAAEARRFSLVAFAGSKMRKYADLALVTADKTGYFDKLKNMIITVFDLNGDLEAPPEQSRSKDLNDSIRSLIRLRDKEHQIKVGVQSYGVAKQLYSNLLTLNWEANQYLAEFAQREADCNAHLVELDAQRSRVESEFAEKNTSLIQGKSELEGRINAVKTQIDFIVKKEEEFKKLDIESKRFEYSGVEQIAKSLQSAQDNFERLQGAHKDVEAAYQLNIRAAEDSANSIIADHKAKMDELRDKNGSLKDKQIQESEKLSSDKAADLKRHHADSDAGLSSLRVDLNLANITLGKSSSYTPDEKEEIVEHENKISELNAEMEGLRKDRSSMESQQLELKREHERLLANHASIQNAIDDESARLDYLEKVRSSKDTLLGVLRNELDEVDFKDAIRLIDKPLLSRSDIKFEKLDQSAGFYGIHLDLSAIPLPVEAQSSEKLLIDIGALREAIDTYKTNKDVIEVELKNTLKLLNDLGVRLAAVNASIESKSKESNRVYKAIMEFKAECDEAVGRRLAQAEMAVNKIKAQIDDREKMNSQLRRNIEKDFEERAAQLKQKYADYYSQNEINIQRLQSLIAKERETYAVRCKEFALLRDEQLKKKGLDVSVIKRAEKEVGDLKDTLVRVRGYAIHISNYDSFVASHQVNKESLVCELQDLESQSRNLFQQIKILKQGFDTDLAAIKVKKDSYTQEVAKLKMQQGDIEVGQRSLTKYVQPFSGMPVVKSRSVSYEAFKEARHQALNEYISINTDLKTLLRGIEIELNMDSRSEVSQVWEVRKENHAQHFNEPYYSLLIMRELEEFMSQEYVKLIDTNMLMLKNVLERISEYYKSIRGFKDLIHMASKKVNSLLKLDDNYGKITDISVEIGSLIDEETPIYIDMKKLVDMYRVSPISQKSVVGTGLLPDLSLMKTLEMAQVALKNTDLKIDNFKRFIELKISVVENGKTKIATSDTSLTSISSTGLTRLVILNLFTSLAREICPDPNVMLHMPFDELAQIDFENNQKLFNTLDKRNIFLFTAQPETNDLIYSSFEYQWIMDSSLGVRRIVDEFIDDDANPYLKALEGA